MSIENLAKQASEFQGHANDVSRMNDVIEDQYDPDKFLDLSDQETRDESNVNEEFDPDQPIEPSSESVENGNEPNQEQFNPDQPLDPQERFISDQPLDPESIDRTEVSNRELDAEDGEYKPVEIVDDRESILEIIKNLWSDYIDDILAKSEYVETIDVDKLKEIELKPVDSETNAKMRDDFNNKKEEVIHEWEQQTGQTWPTYSKDVFIVNNQGDHVKIRSKGDRYDAHHIQPLSTGGENTATNITPMHAKDHMDHKGVHAKDSPYGKLLKAMEGVSQ